MKTKLIFFLLFGMGLVANAQRYAFVDTEYILGNIPAYEAANEKLTSLTQQWQKEIEGAYKEVDDMYKSFQSESVFLSNEMKIKRENDIVQKEKGARALQTKYFGPEGELNKQREALIKPIQDEVFSAIRELVENDGYEAVFDKASGGVVLFSDPDSDVSDKLLQKLGYK